MPSIAEVLETARQLPDEDQILVGEQLLAEAQSRADDGFSDEQREQIDAVLLERLKGPFVPLDDGFVDRVIARGEQILQARKDR